MVRLRAFLSARPVLAMLLLLAAVAVRAVVPSGWMPDADAGVLTVGVCSQDGRDSIRIAIPRADQETAPESGHGTRGCAYAVLAMGLDGADAPALAVLDPLPPLPAIAQPPAMVRLALPHPLPLATGPPQPA